MSNVPHRLRYLHIWFPAGRTVWGAVGAAALLEKVTNKELWDSMASLYFQTTPVLHACGQRSELSAFCSACHARCLLPRRPHHYKL